MNTQSLKLLWHKLFEPAQSNILGWFRLLFCSAIAVEIYGDRFFFQRKQASAFCGRLALFEDFRLPVVSAGEFELFIWLLIGALGLAALGIGRRIPLIVAVVLFGYVLGTVVGCDRGEEKAYTASNHIIVWQNLLILAVAPGVNSWGVNSWIRNERRGSEIPPKWPVELLKFNLVFAYFAGGVAKVRGGLDWMNGYTLQYHLLDRHLSLDIPMAYAFASSWWLCVISSVVMVVLELSCLIVFFVPRLTIFYVGTFFGLQIFWMFLMKLHWMKYFGWAYLIYALELLLFLVTWWTRRSSVARAAQ